MTATSASAKRPANPWMVALTALWCVLLALALLFLVLGAAADALTYDQPGLPTSPELAGIYYACGGVAVGVAAVVIAVQLGVGALRWHLDPSSRYTAPERAPMPRVRNDF